MPGSSPGMTLKLLPTRARIRFRIQLSNSQASSPVLFERRRVRLHFIVPAMRGGRSAARRVQPDHALRHVASLCAETPRFAALHRGVSHLGAVLPGPDRGHPPALIPQAFARVRPVRVQPSKADPVVGSDGEPRRPECVVTSHVRRRRTCPIDGLSPDDAPHGQGAGL